MTEPLLNEEHNRYTLFPIQWPSIWKAYKTQKDAFWTAEEIDLGQDLKDWEKELQIALSLESQHLSLYQLTIENNTAFGRRFKKGKLKGLPTEKLSRKFFSSTNKLCTLSGLKHYEISNFSLKVSISE